MSVSVDFNSFPVDFCALPIDFHGEISDFAGQPTPKSSAKTDIYMKIALVSGFLLIFSAS
jgi:hypothetical protein